MNYETHTIVALSTAHISQADGEKLEEMRDNDLSVLSNTYGWMIHIPPFIESDPGQFSTAMLEVVDTVLSETDADYILFDQDAPADDRFDAFTW